MLSAPNLLTRLVLSSDDADFPVGCLVRLFVARFDSIEAVAERAEGLWYESSFHLKPEMAEPLIGRLPFAMVIVFFLSSNRDLLLL